MTQLKCAVISCPGLGDGLVSLVLSNNMHLNGWEVITYHEKFLMQLQPWFPHLPIRAFPDQTEIPNLLTTFDKIFVSYSSSSTFVQELIKEGKKQERGKLIVLNPSYSKSVGKQPFYEDTFFSPKITVVRNIEIFCHKLLQLSKSTKSNGLIVPYDLQHRQHIKRVILHPTSAKKGKCWEQKKYVKLALQLKQKGYEPVFVMSAEETREWEWIKKLDLQLKVFSGFDALAKFIYESGYMIGNDSGIAHLASSLGLPTVSLFRSFRSAKIWRPGWGENKIICPPRYVPNLSGFRIRDKKWQKFISVRKVLRNFEKLVQRSV